MQVNARVYDALFNLPMLVMEVTEHSYWLVIEHGSLYIYGSFYTGLFLFFYVYYRTDDAHNLEKI